MLKRLTVAAVAALILVTPARADYPGQRPADAELQHHIDSAIERWAARGVTGCSAGIVAWFADDLSETDSIDADGRAMPCRDVWQEPGLIWIHARVRTYPASWRAANECALVEHEVGHALGLRHEDAARWPVMSASRHGRSAECELLVRPELNSCWQRWAALNKKGLRQAERRSRAAAKRARRAAAAARRAIRRARGAAR